MSRHKSGPKGGLNRAMRRLSGKNSDRGWRESCTPYKAETRLLRHKAPRDLIQITQLRQRLRVPSIDEEAPEVEEYKV